MNYFGNYEKDYLLSDMEAFLEDHPVSELLEVVAAAVSIEECRRERE